MKFLLALIALFAIVKAEQVSVGVCNFVGTALDVSATGTAYFVQPTSGGNVSVTLTLSGITSRTDANHGFHIHAWGNISDTAAAQSVGSHFVGAGSSSHGCPSTDTRHEGDMGNVFVDSTGAVSYTNSFDLQTLVATDANSIAGHGAVFHNATDDCAVTTSSGSRLAQCVIGIANPQFTPVSIASANFNNTAGNQNQPSSANRLFCFLQATTLYGGAITGYVDFLGVSGGVQVTAVIQGLTNTAIAYGLHIHEFGDLTGGTGNALGGHYNPTNSTHGLPPNSTRHLGDLGNVCGYVSNAGSSNTFYYQYTNTELSISGVQSFIGRGIALHNKTDVQGATAYGTRVAHGVIGVANASLPAVPDLTTEFSNIQSASCGGPILLTPVATSAPTNGPSGSPTGTPTSAPTGAPTNGPTSAPTNRPTSAPTSAPSTGNSTTGSPTSAPTTRPTSRPTTTTSSASAAAVASFAALVAAAVLLM